MGQVRELIRQNGTLWQALLDLGEIEAKKSICKRKGVCASLYHLATQRCLITTLNGPLPVAGQSPDHCSNEIGNCGCVHAEVLASAWLLANPHVEGLIMTTSYSPCKDCANMIVLSDRIVGVVYLYETENYGDGRDILERNDIPILCVDECEKVDDPSRN